MKDEGGFLLLEVLLALVVLSAGIVLIFRSFSSCLQAASVSKTRFQAVLLAEGGLWELELLGEPPSRDLPDQVSERPVRWDWRKLRPEDANASWREWKLELEWPEGTRRESLALEAYVRE